MYKKIGFIGLGLIGGSIAKTIKRIFPEIELYATSGRESTVKAAYDEGLIINEKPITLGQMGQMDLLFLCAPVQLNNEYLSSLKNFLGPNTIITDVGSVKGNIHECVKIHSLGEHFIGGHPMCGSEKTGLDNSTAYLMENAYYIITPTPEVNPDLVDEFKSFVEKLGAIPLVMDCDTHDRSTAAISHIPHIIASTLVNMVRDIDDSNETMKRIAAGGFKDITRIASSSPVMWQDICLTNKEMIIKTLSDFTNNLNKITEVIEASNGQGINEYFAASKEYRDSINVSSTSYKSFEIFIDLIDEAGGIATVATILASNNISLKNIGIIHNREFSEGVLRLEMYDKVSMESAIETLKKYHYTVYER